MELTTTVYARRPYREEHGHMVPNTCDCGCKGKDPLHRIKTTRKITQIQPQTGNTYVKGFGYGPYCDYNAIGVVNIAGEAYRVVNHKGGWYIAPDEEV